MSVRFAHSDVTVPDFSVYKDNNVSPQAITDFKQHEEQRREEMKTFNYAVTGNVVIVNKMRPLCKVLHQTILRRLKLAESITLLETL